MVVIIKEREVVMSVFRLGGKDVLCDWLSEYYYYYYYNYPIKHYNGYYIFLYHIIINIIITLPLILEQNKQYN